MSGLEVVLLALAVAAAAAGVVVSLRARRLDRLHQTVVLDVAGGILLTDAAEACLSKGMLPIVDDGLDGIDLEFASRGVADDRRSIESSLSRTLRLTVDELESDEIASDAQDVFERLARSRLDVRMTRTFHNSHVDQIRRLRRSFAVRVLRLAGRAPIPSTVDIDDE